MCQQKLFFILHSHILLYIFLVPIKYNFFYFDLKFVLFIFQYFFDWIVNLQKFHIPNEKFTNALIKFSLQINYDLFFQFQVKNCMNIYWHSVMERNNLIEFKLQLSTSISSHIHFSLCLFILNMIWTLRSFTRKILIHRNSVHNVFKSTFYWSNYSFILFPFIFCFFVRFNLSFLLLLFWCVR